MLCLFFCFLYEWNVLPNWVNKRIYLYARGQAQWMLALHVMLTAESNVITAPQFLSEFSVVVAI